MTNEQTEFLTLAEASKIIPGNPGIVTLWRWRTKGVHGVRLRSACAGRVPCTTRAWIEQFMIEVEEAKRDEREMDELGWDRDILADAVA